MRGVMAPCPSVRGILAVLSLVALSNAGPLGPLPNVTSSDAGLKEGSCVLGDVVYMSGDTFAGATPCEHCACAAGSVQCAQERCEPRPGCKALHRPDHCCPTYQCECEQEGRVYGNGEKLVDPEDPCRVCYCQGGEVVCRRIACFLRDDCQPRLVPGRCCPEYDNCPLRGVTSIPGLTPPVSSISTTGNIASSPAPAPPKESIRQEITIKEITPVSEIPVITDVKIKEILPSPSIEVPEYPSSKSPLIPREAIPDNTVTSSAEISPKTEESVIIELISPLIPTELSSKPAEKSTADMLPSKISLSTQDSINSEIYPSHIPTIIATMGVSPLTPENIPVASTTRVAIIEEEDIDHNPAFPPIPDDFVFGTHEDESLSEQTADNDHITNVHGEQHVASTPSPPPMTIASREIPNTTARTTAESTSTTTTTTEKQITEATSMPARTPENIETSTAYVLTSTTVQTAAAKGSVMLDIRTAIPNEILNLPPTIPEDITGELDDPEESVTTFQEPLYIVTSSTTTEPVIRIVYDTTIPPQIVPENNILPRSSEVTNTPFDTTTETPHSATSTTFASVTKSVDETTIAPQIIIQNKILPRASEVINTPFDTITETTHSATFTPTESVTKLEDETTVSLQIVAKDKFLPRSTEVTNAPFDTTTQTTQKITEAQEISTTKFPEGTVAVPKSNIATEITSQTEFSSLPIETSDQNPQYSSESVPKEKTTFTTKAPLNTEITPAKETTELEEVTTTRTNPTSPSTPEIHSFENVETTEFVLTSFGSSESTTDAVEVIKISPTQKERNAAIIDSASGKKTNVLTDLINLVGDVASISKHTDAPEAAIQTTTSNSFSDSEELMPVNAGYKSKNSNFNLNSITEIPLKSKNQLPVNKQKVVEIQDEDTDNIADALPPHDKVEPTTRRPIIDNVSDSMPKNETEQKDIEIISQSYVPTINRRPTKVVMKKNKDKPLSDASTEGPTLSSVSSDGTTSPDDLTASPVIVTESGFSSGELGSTVDPTVGADSTTTVQ